MCVGYLEDGRSAVRFQLSIVYICPPPQVPPDNTLSGDELRQALLAMVKSKDEVEEKRRCGTIVLTQ